MAIYEDIEKMADVRFRPVVVSVLFSGDAFVIRQNSRAVGAISRGDVCEIYDIEYGATMGIFTSDLAHPMKEQAEGFISSP